MGKPQPPVNEREMGMQLVAKSCKGQVSYQTFREPLYNGEGGRE